MMKGRLALRDEITSLRDRVLSELDVAHDYYTDTTVAWSIVRRLVASGRKISVRNRVTGTKTSETELAAKASGYVSEQLAGATFQQFLSIFENFIFDLLRLWLVAYPQSLNEKKTDFHFKDVLDASDKDAIVSLFIDRELIEIAYRKPAEWFEYLGKKVKLNRPTSEEIEKFVEAKASRDALVHNRGIANHLYEVKAGKQARYQAGEKIEIPEHYHRETWNLLRKLVQDLCDSAAAKAT